MIRAAAVALGAAMFVGCHRPCPARPVPLLLGLASRQTQDAARRQLAAAQTWQVVRDEKGPTDGRPRFDFVQVGVGSLVDRGHTGGVQLWFYNDRLMTVSFTPKDPAAYFDAVKATPGAKVLDDRIVAMPDGARVWRIGGPEGALSTIEWFTRVCAKSRTRGS